MDVSVTYDLDGSSEPGAPEAWIITRDGKLLGRIIRDGDVFWIEGLPDEALRGIAQGEYKALEEAKAAIARF
jgi:hypothetical protein